MGAAISAGESARRRHLIKQRLKEVIIRPVDHGHIHCLAGKMLGRLQSTKAGPDYHHPRKGTICISHR